MPWNDYNGLVSSTEPSIVVIGNFDGVHRGHQHVLLQAIHDAQENGLSIRALTFDPHPAVVLGRYHPPILTRLERKLELLARIHPTIHTTVLPFTSSFAEQTPTMFVERILVGELHARKVIVGNNFRFGKDKSGGIQDLQMLGHQFGFEVTAADLIGDPEGPWSSTRIRAAIQEGQLGHAMTMLGRPHMVSGIVTKGAQRGRTLGFPTCNLGEIEEVLPPFGVYAVLVDKVEDIAASPHCFKMYAKGVANLGIRPTLEQAHAKPVLEVHLFDTNADLYGSILRVHFFSKLRDEMKFINLESLRVQIDSDARAARTSLASAQPDPNAVGAWR